MRPLAALAVLASLVAPASAQASIAPPMLLPATGSGAAAASAQPPTWLVAASPTSVAADRIARRHGAARLRVQGVYRVDTRRARAFAGALRAAGALRFAEPDEPMRRASALDALPAGYARNLVVDPSLAPPAPGPRSAVIAVVDDVVDTTHPDLAANTTVLTPGPVLGPHGTMVASAAAGALNGFGVFGVFPSARVLSIGLPPDITCALAADGIVKAAKARAKIINLSFGAEQGCFTLFLAVEIAYARKSLVVAAAGNEFGSGNPSIYPAAFPHVLAVASLDPDLRASGFSSDHSYVDLSAPGVNVPLAIPAALDTADGAVDGVTLASGTSFATPIVAGAAAWLATARPKLTNGQLADVLRESARDVGAQGYDTATGFGLVQMRKALREPAPARDPREPNDDIAFVDGSVLGRPAKDVWRGAGTRSFSAGVDRVKDPLDVYRVRLPPRSRARIRVRPRYGNPDLYVFRSSATWFRRGFGYVARSRRATRKTESVTISNRSAHARRFYVAVDVRSDATGSLSSDYRLELRRIKRR